MLADERGITLQTLIVTAVLVLMAGAAGVVIIAITNSAEDNLANQATDIPGRCAAWEIHDPTLEAAGRGGTPAQGGLESSAIGCRRVCYAQTRGNVSTLPVATTELVSHDKSSKADSDLLLIFSRSGIPNNLTVSPTAAKVSQVVTDDRETKTRFTNLVKENQRIEVSTNQRYCRVWDDSSDQEIASLRSD